jgi:hypothetical protein
VLKQVHLDAGMSTMSIMNLFVNDVFERIRKARRIQEMQDAIIAGGSVRSEAYTAWRSFQTCNF